MKRAVIIKHANKLIMSCYIPVDNGERLQSR